MSRDQHNYLIHWLKKGEKAKYVDKIKLANGRWRYFYSQAELEAYKLKRKLGASAGELANKAKQGLRNLKEGALNTGARAVVGVAKRNKTVYDRLGGSWKTNAQDSASYANALQRQANVAKRDADTARAQAAAARRNGGKYVLDTGAVIGEKTESEWANKRDHQAKDSAIRASGARQDAAGYQKQYDRSILGRAEKRVKTDDIRRNNEKRRAAQQANNKQTTPKSSRESLGSRASKALSNAKEAVADKAAEAVVGAANRNSTVRSLIGGQRQDKARSYGNAATDEQNYANMLSRKAATSRAEGASLRRRGRTSGADDSRRRAEAYEYSANGSNERASTLRSAAAREQKAYEQSLLGRAQARVNRKKSRR